MIRQKAPAPLTFSREKNGGKKDSRANNGKREGKPSSYHPVMKLKKAGAPGSSRGKVRRGAEDPMGTKR